MLVHNIDRLEDVLVNDCKVDSAKASRIILIMIFLSAVMCLYIAYTRAVGSLTGRPRLVTTCTYCTGSHHCTGRSIDVVPVL